MLPFLARIVPECVPVLARRGAERFFHRVFKWAIAHLKVSAAGRTITRAGLQPGLVGRLKDEWLEQRMPHRYQSGRSTVRPPPAARSKTRGLCSPPAGAVSDRRPAHSHPPVLPSARRRATHAADRSELEDAVRGWKAQASVNRGEGGSPTRSGGRPSTHANTLTLTRSLPAGAATGKG